MVTETEAYQIFKQFGEPYATLYLPDGTPADVLNRGTEEFGAENVPYDLADTYQHYNIVANPLAKTQYNSDGATTGADKSLWETLFGPTQTVPWGWIIGGVVALIVLPPLLSGRR